MEQKHAKYQRLLVARMRNCSHSRRQLSAELESSDPRAQFAVDLFVYRIGRELGSLAAAIGGLDALVFTAGIGEHSAVVREQVCKRASWLGVELDPSANAAGGPRITTTKSRVSAWVIPTDEDLMIARHTVRLLAANGTLSLSMDANVTVI